MSKIAVYAICKNEEKFVKRWADSIIPELQPNDNIVVYDTGSTDNTLQLFEQYDDRVIVRYNTPINPFRFDVARNIALNDVPADVDVCVKSDIDEVFHKGWRAAIENKWINGIHPQRLRANYIWNHDELGNPNIVFQHDCMIHSRHGYVWKHACHEIIEPTSQNETVNDCSVTFEHFADLTKSRSNYLSLLKLNVEEQPNDPRSRLYYARELWFHGNNTEALGELKKFLTFNDTWCTERAYALRIMAKIDKGNTISLLKEACVTSPGDREPFIELAEATDTPQERLSACQAALAITNRPQHYLTEPRCWGSLPYDLASLGAYYSGQIELALHYALEALAFKPLNPRLQNNINLIKKRLFEGGER